jgi:hypothetical protein
MWKSKAENTDEQHNMDSNFHMMKIIEVGVWLDIDYRFMHNTYTHTLYYPYSM